VTDKERTYETMKRISHAFELVGLNEGAYEPYAYHKWSGGRFKYKFVRRKLLLVVEFDGNKFPTRGYVPDVLHLLPDEISEPFLYVLDLC
jgi:hypothetical protein